MKIMTSKFIQSISLSQLKDSTLTVSTKIDNRKLVGNSILQFRVDDQLMRLIFIDSYHSLRSSLYISVHYLYYSGLNEKERTFAAVEC